ncbi:DUF3168 domain-containing protein [Sphingopyxis sp. RIFCSPHIGHO2_12_FULL_65_19]|uniref:DUF3168 domain-containing protein n=1 Tax=Sphingopyxis sp. RIFCSPHIGHO2_12_FULL_65_19 TaxID=1802172 RepID=UPI0008C27A52|nr:DUF3168 domain-containing protein [Sphingopyxis sp. RIFCSPHIGHO2_12_FULL_65_19]OHD04461.1 MAG: hypothetical protein A3E77_16680 [Sphingopyxis sp. RIFCSPHIGHO2_12_FULL_65_19]
MTGVDGALRARVLDLLARDAALAGLVHGIFDGTPPRASAPYVSIGAAEGREWGTKDRAGREIRLTLTLVGVGDAAADAAARIEAVVGALRGAAGDWTVVAVRTIRTRFTFARDGGWRHDMVVRCRCLAA